MAFDYLTGAGFLRRKLASAFHPSLTITVDGDSITITMSMGPKTNKETFKLGEEYECRPPPNETPSKVIMSTLQLKFGGGEISYYSEVNRSK